MYKASIFQKNITRNSTESEKAIELFELNKIKKTIIKKGNTIVFWRTAIPKLIRIYAEGMLSVKMDKKENQKKDLKEGLIFILIFLKILKKTITHKVFSIEEMSNNGLFASKNKGLNI